MATIKCPSCSATVDDSMLFCPDCFNEFEKPRNDGEENNGGDKAKSDERSGDGDVIVCPSCGEKAAKGMLFCPACFTEFDNSSFQEPSDASDYESAAADDPDFDPSLLIDNRYKIVDTFKEGCSVSIYKVEDKVDRKSLYSLREFNVTGEAALNFDDTVQKFEDIASKILKASHPSIAKIFDYFNYEGKLYLVYEYSEGSTLTSFLQKFHERTSRAVPEGILASIALKLLDLLECIHNLQSPLFAVDMRPSSVVISDDASNISFVNLGIPYVQDLLGEYKDVDITEEFSFKTLETPKRDLWCVGAILYFLISGLDLQMFETREPSPIRDIRKDLSDAFVSFLEKLLGKGRLSDYGSVGEAKKELAEKVKARGLESYDFYYDMIGFDSSDAIWFTHLADNARTACIGGSSSLPMKLLWTFAASIRASAFITPFNGNIAVVFNDGNIFVFDAAKGSFIWNCNMREKLNPVISDGKRIYASSSYSPSVFCFAPESENPGVWRAVIDGMLMTPPVLWKGVLYQTSYTGVIFAIDPESGKSLWHESLDAMTISSPVMYEDALVTAGLNGVVYAFSFEKKRVTWSFETKGAISLPCSLKEDYVLVVTTTGEVFCIDCRSAALKWKLQADSPLSGCVRALPGMYIFITQKGIMYNVAPDGSINWRLKLGGHGDYFYSVTNNKAYVFAPDGRILIIDLFSGKLIDKNSVKLKLACEPILYDGRLIFVIQDGTVFCYG